MRNRGGRGRPDFRRRSRLVSFACLLSVASGGARAADQAPDLSALDLEALMKVEVSSVSRKSQLMSDVAAAVYVISHNDIKRSGATSIPEILRLAPGLQVARVGASAWAVSARGFNWRYSDKLLVLMDGRTLYTPLFSGVFWNVQDTMIEDIERVEVIRGPGAAMWGSNAVNGVINIITRSASHGGGGLAVVGAGSDERGFASARYAGAAGDNTGYRIYAKAFDRGPTVAPGGERADDDWRAMQAGFRVDHSVSAQDKLTVQGDAYRAIVGERVHLNAVLTPPYQADYATDDRASGANVLLKWSHRISDISDFVVQTYYDRARFTAPKLSADVRTYDVDFQHRIRPGERHDFMWGVSYRALRIDTDGSADISFTPDQRNGHISAVFFQDDIALIRERLRLTLGGKYEKSYTAGGQWQPNVRLLWTPNDDHAVWAAYSRASRTPSYGETSARIALGVVPPGIPQNPAPAPVAIIAQANPDLAAERLTAYELGYRAQLHKRLSIDAALFTNRYRDLSMLTAGASAFETAPLPHVVAPVVYGNDGQGYTARGLELVADWRVLDWMRVEATYTHIRMDSRTLGSVGADVAGAVPRNQASLRWQMDLSARTQLDGWLRYVGRLSGADQGVDAYTTLDMRLATNVRPDLELALIGQNLLDSRHLEFREAFGARPYEIRRGAYVKATLKF
ncbi:MAG: TonB-dependent receptor [Rhodocyclales bacterium]|nr:TonB-dependent receptor [Rhodocyclales bacterium]